MDAFDATKLLMCLIIQSNLSRLLHFFKVLYKTSIFSHLFLLPMTFSKKCVSTSKSDNINLKDALYFTENLKRLQYYYNGRCTTKQLIDIAHIGG